MAKTIAEFEALIPDLELLKKQNDKKRNAYLNSIFEKELLIEIFITSNLSAHRFVCKYAKPKNLTTSASTIIDLAKKHGIKTKTIKESNSLQAVKEKRKKTCIEKYGKENCLSRGTVSYKKRNETVKQKYGVNNVFQLQEVKEKSRKTFYEKYGVISSVFLESFKSNNGKLSTPHKKVSDFLNEHNINHKNEVKNLCRKFNKELGCVYSPILDIQIDQIGLVIEIFGDHYHCNKKDYKPMDSVEFLWSRGKRKFKTAQEVWEFDKIRLKQIKSFGYKVFVFWESQINNYNKFEKIKSKILSEVKSKNEICQNNKNNSD